MSQEERDSNCQAFEDLDHDSDQSYEPFIPEYCFPEIYRGSAFQGQMMLLSAATQYGCWCDISNDLRRHSHEPPVNELDQACKTLHHNYNCISKDHFGCDPRSLDTEKNEYVLPLVIFAPSVNIGEICSDANVNNPCGRDTCIVEAEFLRTTYAPVYNGDEKWLNMWEDNRYKHEMIGGDFNFYRDCSVDRPSVNNGGNGGGAGGNGEKNPRPTEFKPLPNECCGSLPSRNEFSPSFHVCCDGNVEDLGTC